MSDETPYTPIAPDYGAPPNPDVVYTPPPPQSNRERLEEPRKMSAVARLVNIFFSPGEVFEDIRRSPTDWWLPFLIILVVACASGPFIQSRIGVTPEGLAQVLVDDQLQQQGKIRKDLTPQETTQLEAQEKVMTFVFRYGPAFAPLFLLLIVFIVAGLHRLILLMMGTETTFFRVLSVVVYSYYASLIVKCLLQVVLVLVRPGGVEPMEYLRQGGVLAASPAAFVSFTEHPALWAILSRFDVFTLWWFALIMIGLPAASRRLSRTAGAVAAWLPYVVFVGLQDLLTLARGK